jgi:MFS family permease
MHHPLETSVAVAAAVVGVAFGLSTLERWLRARRPHELAWSAALAMFAVAAGALAYGAQAGWSGPVFRVFYLFGAIADVPVLALGTVYLLAGRKAGNVTAIGVALVCAFAAGVVVMAPFRAPLPVDELAQGSKVFDPLPRVLAAVGSAGGAAAILGGALWSAWRVRRSHGERRLLWSNGLIAVGTLVLGASGTLNSVFGAMTAFAVTLLVGISVIFAGFLVASGAGRRRAPTSVQALQPAPPWKPPARTSTSVSLSVSPSASTSTSPTASTSTSTTAAAAPSEVSA